MTTSTPSRIVGAQPAVPASGASGATDPTGPTGSSTTAPESPEARAARLALRRRLVTWSAPVVALLLLVALKLLTMVAIGQQAQDAYAAGNVTETVQDGSRLGFLNLIEPHKAPFAQGDGLVLGGDLDGARQAFEKALTLAPSDGLEACQVRVNLALTLEKLGDAAKSASGVDAAKPYYDRVQAVAAAAPPGCFTPEGQGTGQQLKDAASRAQGKGQQTAPSQGQQGTDPGSGGQTPDQQKQQQLDTKTQDNQAQRAQGLQGQNDGGASQPQVARPW